MKKLTLAELEQIDESDVALRATEDIERRTVKFVFDIRSNAAGAPMICGHASVFNQTADLGYFYETVMAGAFTKTIANDDIRALFNHDPNLILGRNKAGTLTLEEDQVGLAMCIMPSDRSYEQDLMKSIQRGDVNEASFGFRTVSRNLREVDGELYRDLTEVQLFDVSPVTFPAYDGTDVCCGTGMGMGMRSLRAIALKEFRRGSEMAASADAEAWKHDIDNRRRLLEIVRI